MCCNICRIPVKLNLPHNALFIAGCSANSLQKSSVKVNFLHVINRLFEKVMLIIDITFFVGKIYTSVCTSLKGGYSPACTQTSSAVEKPKREVRYETL